MVRRYRPVHKIYNAYKNLQKLKGPKHWYAGSNYFSNQVPFNFRTYNYRRSKVSFLLKYFWVYLGCSMNMEIILKIQGDSSNKLNIFISLEGLSSSYFNDIYFMYNY